MNVTGIAGNINNIVQCTTMVTDYSGSKTICTNGKSCVGKCIVANAGTTYCLVNVKFLNKSPQNYIGYYNPCQGGLSSIPRF